MPTTDALGIRMKENYEKISQTKLLRRTPVAIRIDGRSFHTWARGFAKPFDEILRMAGGNSRLLVSEMKDRFSIF